MTDELDLLIELYLDKSALPEQMERLEEMLQSDPRARATLLSSMAAVLSIRDLAQAEDRPESGPESARRSATPRGVLVSLALAACAAFVTAAFLLFWPSPEIATLVVSGSGVEIERSSRILPIRETFSLRDGDQVRSNSQTGGVILFPDSTQLEISPNSNITLSRQAGKQLWLEHGTIVAKVTKQPKDQPLRIETKTALVEVVGTEFQLRAAQYSTRIHVTEGTVRFQRRADHMETLVSQGQQAIATAQPDGSMFAATVHSPAFLENFEDEKLASRGWYDDVNPAFSEQQRVNGSQRSVEFRFPNGTSKPMGGGIALRRKIPATEAVCVAYWIKREISGNNASSGSDVKLLTNKDGDWVGPGCTHLTITIGTNEDCPAVWIQDALNMDESRLGQNLVGITEFRAVAGGNGDSDGYGEGVTYQRDDPGSKLHSNWKGFTAESPLFHAATDPLARNGWQYVVVYVKLNTIQNGKGIPDGHLRYWCNGRLALNYDKILFRTAANEDMKLNQLLIAPSLHNSPGGDQSLWLDDLTVMPGVLPADWEPRFPTEE